MSITIEKTSVPCKHRIYVDGNNVGLITTHTEPTSFDVQTIFDNYTRIRILGSITDSELATIEPLLTPYRYGISRATTMNPNLRPYILKGNWEIPGKYCPDTNRYLSCPFPTMMLIPDVPSYDESVELLYGSSNRDDLQLFYPNAKIFNDHGYSVHSTTMWTIYLDKMASLYRPTSTKRAT